MTTQNTFTSADVFEHAALIGRDIEHIVNEYGNEVIEELMPKIIYLLEQLENLTEQSQKNEDKIQELSIEKESLLIHTKRDEAIQRELQEKLYYIESLLSSDSKDLQEKIKVLQKENDCLCEELDNREDEIIKMRTSGALPGDVEVMVRMKETIDSQRDQMRQRNAEVHSQKKEIEALQDQIDRLTDINEQIRLSNFKLNAKIKEFSLKDDTCVEDILSTTSSSTDTVNKHRTKSLDVSISDELASMNESLDTDYNIESNENIEEQTEVVVTPKKKDPNRPRYTLQEMQKVLEERNMFKIKMTALEEELDLIKEKGSKIVQSSYSESNVDQLKKNQGGVRLFMQKFIGKY